MTQPPPSYPEPAGQSPLDQPAPTGAPVFYPPLPEAVAPPVPMADPDTVVAPPLPPTPSPVAGSPYATPEAPPPTVAPPVPAPHQVQAPAPVQAREYDVPTLSFQQPVLEQETSNDAHQLKAPLVVKEGRPELERLLAGLVTNGGSDLHLVHGQAPRFRQAGELLAVAGEPPVYSNDIERLIKGIVSEAAWDEYQRTNDLDTSYSMDVTEGAAITSRFRVNTMRSMGAAGIVIRVIPSKIVTLDELGLLPQIKGLAGLPRGMVLFTGPTGSGKMVSLSTTIPTPSGNTTMGELRHGDWVLGRDGKPCQVTGLSPIVETPNLYRVTFSDGQTVLADYDHQWLVASHHHRSVPRTGKRQAALDRFLCAHEDANLLDRLAGSWDGAPTATVDELFEIADRGGAGREYPSPVSVYNAMRMTDCVGFPETRDVQVVAYPTAVALKSMAVRLRERFANAPNEEASLSRMTTGEMLAAGLRLNTGHANFAAPLAAALDLPHADLPVDPYSMGALLGDRSNGQHTHIPLNYLRASAEQRLALLQGLMDTEGDVGPGGSCELSMSDPRIVSDALNLIRSLGIKASVSSDQRSIHFTTNQPVFRLPRKLARLPEAVRETQGWLYITDIEPVPADDPDYGPARCITVDSPDHTYLCGDGYVVTSNSTSMAGLVDLINETRTDRIVTLEDPVEFVHTSKKCLISHREIGKDTPSFEEGLRRVRRQDPDVILVGEMRDYTTIAAAIEAADTGHLVIATLHTNSAPETISRIINSFPAGQQAQIRTTLSSTLKAIICQTLVPSPKTAWGRVCATEIMLVNGAISANIRDNDIKAIEGALVDRSAGNISLDAHLVELVRQGLITKKEAHKKATSPRAFDQMFGTNRENK